MNKAHEIFKRESEESQPNPKTERGRAIIREIAEAKREIALFEIQERDRNKITLSTPLS